MPASISENRFLYMLKGIACILVVFIHYPMSGSVGTVMTTLARFAVPFFFIVSGRYMFDVQTIDIHCTRKKLFRRLLKLLQSLLIVLVVYSIYSYYIQSQQGVDFRTWFITKYASSEIIRQLIVNTSYIIFDHTYYMDFMWYLFAMIYVYLFMVLCANWRMNTKCAICIVLLCALYVLQYLFCLDFTFPGINVWCGGMSVYRNWLFTGIPFALVGVWISHSTLLKTGSPIIWWTATVCGIAIAIIEGFCSDMKELPLGMMIAVISLAVLAEYYPDRGIRVLVFIGKNLSSNVYYWHVLVANILYQLVIINWPEHNLFPYWPIIVSSLTLLISLVLYGVNRLTWHLLRHSE